MDGAERGARPRRADHPHRGQRGALGADPRLVPARRPAARPLRARAASRRPAATSSAAGRSTPTSTRSRRSAPTSTSAAASSCAPRSSSGQRIFLDEASVMGTENAVMAAVLAEGETVLMNAACEPHVQDLCRFLVSLGARIEGIGSNVLRIEGVDELTGGDHRIGSEHIEAASFIGLAAVTGGDITIENVEPDDFVSILAAFARLGVRVELNESERSRAARPGARDPRRPRRPDPEDRGRPVARVPGRPDVDRARRRHAGAGHDPDLREDVREPPVLRRQARPDGCPDHPLRPAPRRRHRPGAAARRALSRAPTSVPEWRC